MAYFATSLGQLPIPTPQRVVLLPVGAGWELTWAAAPPGISAVAILAGAHEPLERVGRLPAAAQRWPVPAECGPMLSVAWERSGVLGPPAPAVALAPVAPLMPPGCPLCRGYLSADAGLWRCTGRCQTRWAQDASGRLLDLAALALSVCACCDPARPLVRGDHGVLCPHTALPHLLRPASRAAQVQHIAGSACTCCAPPHPLVQLAEACLCPVQPQHTYVLTPAGWVTAAQAQPAATLEAIDAALKTNTAQWSLYGLFDP